MSNSLDRNTIRELVREAIEKQHQTDAIPPSPEKAEQLQVQTVDESLKEVITETEIRAVPSGGRLLLREGAIITPSAQDLIRENQITVHYRKSSQRIGKQRIVAVGSDHGGFEMKEQLKALLVNLGYQHRDFGTLSAEAVDYPDFAHAVARAVAENVCDLGIILDGAGIGSCMTANKVPGIRAAMCYDEATAKNSREHNYANVLTLGAKMISKEKMNEIVKAWLATDEGETRHGKRVAKIMAIEKQYLR
ncbi:MAG: ribose 5-phosphate isomerase B [Acidobacteria bacterium]|nr:ribose 5-phosphate isomerase B [Acidobacteriota bacterium]